MFNKRAWWLVLLLILLPLARGISSAQAPGEIEGGADPSTSADDGDRYEYRSKHDPNGIGKFYMGREIAMVMGHQGIDWLERPEREVEEAPAALVQSLGIQEGMVVADIGAGSGYFSFRLAKLVGDEGRVLAVDIQQEMLDVLKRRMREKMVTNIQPVLGTITDPKLPEGSVDLILMVDVYHEFSHPYEMVAAMVKSLKVGGRIVFVEYRLEDPNVPIKLVHKMSEKQVLLEMKPHPLRWVGTVNTLPRQHVIHFEKQGEKAAAPERVP